MGPHISTTHWSLVCNERLGYKRGYLFTLGKTSRLSAGCCIYMLLSQHRCELCLAQGHLRTIKPSHKQTNYKTLLTCKPFLKSSLQNQSIHKYKTKHTYTKFKSTLTYAKSLKHLPNLTVFYPFNNAVGPLTIAKVFIIPLTNAKPYMVEPIIPLTNAKSL